MGIMRIQLKNRIVKSVLWSVVLYASETWLMTQADRRRLEAMETGNVDLEKDGEKQLVKIRNEEVLQRVNETKTMLDTVRKRKCVVMACAKT